MKRAGSRGGAEPRKIKGLEISSILQAGIKIMPLSCSFLFFWGGDPLSFSFFLGGGKARRGGPRVDECTDVARS